MSCISRLTHSAFALSICCRSPRRNRGAGDIYGSRPSFMVVLLESLTCPDMNQKCYGFPVRKSEATSSVAFPRKQALSKERSSILMIYSALARVFPLLLSMKVPPKQDYISALSFLFCPNCKCTQMPPTEEFLCVTKGRPFRADHKALPDRQNQKHYFS
jgi:hypothetical protein